MSPPHDAAAGTPTLGDLLADAPARDTFLGVPRCDDLGALDAHVAVIGAPVATPYPSLGAYAAGAPRAIRDGAADFAGAVRHEDFDLGGPLLPDGARVVDCGDLDGDEADAPGNRARVTAAVRAILDAGALPVVLGGDDSVPIPVFQAFEGRGPLTVVQVDAHIDWRDEVRGERLGLSSTMRRASEMPWIGRIVQAGARGVGSARPADLAAARAWGARIVTAREVHARGVQQVVEQVPAGARVLLSIDCDGLDPAPMPAVIAPAPGGLSYWQVLELMLGIAARARIECFDVVEFMPARDRDGAGARTAARLVCSAVGLLARQALAR